MKCIICVDCRMVILASNLVGHLADNPKHKPIDGTRISTTKIQADIKEYLESLDLDESLVRRPAPDAIIPAYSSLEKPQSGYRCTIRVDYAAVQKDTLWNHIQEKNGPKGKGCCDGASVPSDMNWTDLMESCSV